MNHDHIACTGIISTPRRAHAVALYFSVWLLLLGCCATEPAIADNAVNASAQQISQATWAANALYHCRTSGDPADSLLLVYSYNIFRSDPHVDVEEALKELNTYRQQLRALEFQETGSHTDSVAALMDLAAAAGSSSTPANTSLANDLLHIGNDGDETFWQSGTQLNAQHEILALQRDGDSYLDSSATQLWNLARANPNVAKAVDAFFGGTYQASVHDDAISILDKNPGFADFRSVKAVRNALSSDDSLATTVNTLTGQVGSSTQQLAETIDSGTTALKALQANLADTWKQQSATAEAERTFQAERTEVAAGAASIQLITKIIALKNPSLAARLGTIGTSASQMATAVVDYGQNAATLHNELGGFGSILSVAQLANSLVGAAFNIAGALDGSSSATEMELAHIDHNIQKLQASVDDMHQEMRVSFLHIDAKLDTAIGLVNAGFQATLDKLNGIQTDLVSVRQQLLQQSAALDALRRNILQYSTDQLITPYLADINECLGFRARNPQKSISDREYDRCVSKLESFGTTVAKTATLSSSWNGGDVYQAGTDILDRGTDADINELAGLAANWGSIPPQQQLPNPVVWMSAVDALVTFSIQWPEQFRAQSESADRDLLKTGQQLVGFSRALVIQSANGRIVPNYGVFEKAIGMYETDLEAVDKIMQNRADTWLLKNYPDPQYHSAILNEMPAERYASVTATASVCQGSAVDAGGLPVDGARIDYMVGIESTLENKPPTFCYNATYQQTAVRQCSSNAYFSCGSQIAWGVINVDLTGIVVSRGKDFTIFHSTVNSGEFAAQSGTVLSRSDAPMVPVYSATNFLGANWGGGEHMAQAINGANHLSDTESAALNELHKEFDQELATTELPEVRRTLTAYLISLMGTDIQFAESLKRLDISKELLNEYVELGAPDSYTSDGIRALFLGDAALWDSGIIRVALRSSDSLQSMIARGQNRAKEAKSMIAGVVAAEAARNQPQVDQLVSVALDRLEMLRQLRR